MAKRFGRPSPQYRYEHYDPEVWKSAVAWRPRHDGRGPGSQEETAVGAV